MIGVGLLAVAEVEVAEEYGVIGVFQQRKDRVELFGREWSLGGWILAAVASLDYWVLDNRPSWIGWVAIGFFVVAAHCGYGAHLARKREKGRR